MKQKLKKILIIIAVILFAFILLLSAPRVTKAASKASTFKYVQDNHTQLYKLAQDVIDGKIHTPFEYEKYTMQYFKSLSVKEPVVEFNGYSFGLAPSGYYTGFYYSPNDIPVRFNGSGTAMEPYKKGWTYTIMGNHGYTEKICDNWYWFEFYF